MKSAFNLILTFFTLIFSTASAQPQISRQPSAITEAVGGNIAFATVATSPTPISYQWRKNGIAIGGATNAMLFLPNITLADAGDFTCVITDTGGTVTSAAARLSVINQFSNVGLVDPSFVVSPALEKRPLVTAVQADGKILVGGDFVVLNQGRPQLGLVRLNSDGSHDTSFQFGSISAGGAITAIAVLESGKILIGGGFSTVGGTPRANLAQLNADGSLDASFVPGEAAAAFFVRRIVVGSAGKIAISSLDGVDTVRLLLPNGTVDPAFTLTPVLVGTDTGTLPVYGRINALQFQSGERLILNASALTAGSRYAALLRRLNTNGSRDPTFVPDFPTQGRIQTGAISARDFRVLTDDNFFLAADFPSGVAGFFRVQRYLSDGTLDPLYAITTVDTGSVSAAAIDAAGRTILAGTFNRIGDVSTNGFARIASDGSLDQSYRLGSGFILSPGGQVAVQHLEALPDGRALVAGDFNVVEGLSRPYLARLNASSLGGANLPAILAAVPSATTTRAGESIGLRVTATGSAPLSYRVTAPDGSVAATTTSFGTVTLPNPQLSGTYRLTVTGIAGATTTSDFQLTVTPAAPTIIRQPEPLQTNSGRTAVLSAETIGSDPRTYQWFRNDSPVAGATAATFTLTAATPAHAGDYTLVVRNGLGLVASRTVRLSVDETARLGSLATRGSIGIGENVLINGFNITGPGPKTVLIRGIGPSLAPLGVSAPLANPQLTLFDDTGKQIAENDNWGGSSTLSAVFTRFGAFPLPVSSLDSALVISLEPGGYTAQLAGNSGASGVGLVEVYEADGLSSRLTALSSRLRVGLNQSVAIPGLSVQGLGPRKLLIRAVGPTLAQFGVASPLADPIITLLDSSGAIVSTNDNWGGTPALVSAFENLTFPLPAGSKDAAILNTLLPGSYTALVSGVGATSGVVLIEIYELK